jgi:hypothetical protein
LQTNPTSHNFRKRDTFPVDARHPTIEFITDHGIRRVTKIKRFKVRMDCVSTYAELGSRASGFWAGNMFARANQRTFPAVGIGYCISSSLLNIHWWQNTFAVSCSTLPNRASPWVSRPRARQSDERRKEMFKRRRGDPRPTPMSVNIHTYVCR